MSSLQSPRKLSTRDAPRHCPPYHLTKVERWRAYDRYKRRLAVQYEPGSEAYDTALQRYLDEVGL